MSNLVILIKFDIADIARFLTSSKYDLEKIIGFRRWEGKVTANIQQLKMKTRNSWDMHNVKYNWALRWTPLWVSWRGMWNRVSTVLTPESRQQIHCMLLTVQCGHPIKSIYFTALFPQLANSYYRIRDFNHLLYSKKQRREEGNDRL